MGARPRNLPLLVGLLASVAMHMMAILPLFRAAMAAKTPPYAVFARFDPDDFARDPEEEPEPPEMLLGIDTPEDRPTMTWIGHREYEEHLARLADVEQAAFTTDAAVAGQQTPESADGRGAAPAPEPPEAQPEQEQQPEREPETPEPVEEPELSPADLLAIESLFRALGETPAPVAVREETETEEAPERRETETEDWLDELRKIVERVERSAEAEPAPKTPPGNAPVAGAEPNPGEQADQESDATSVVEIPLDELKPGKPIARQGLALHPRRPSFTDLVRVTAAAGNPLVEIRFAKSGKPDRATILESSGDRRIDHAIESSLYRWRASGPPLDALAADGHVDIRIRILLNRRGR
jgi:hypothetical protein